LFSALTVEKKCTLDALRVICGSGRAREESNAVDGTGFAGVRG
jgi:hypothetical protein